VRSIVSRLSPDPVQEKRMFGGLALMLRGHMAVVVRGKGGGIMVRVDPAEAETFVGEPGAALMVMNGRTMRGWVTVSADAVATDAGLRRWVKRGVAFTLTLPPK
jgi:TfoX/Sxy family transcriptional regulator of competence genes